MGTPFSRAACSTFRVPLTLTLWVPMGSWMERGMRAQAAVWKTQPAPSVTEATRAASVTEPWTRVAAGLR